ncbi:MAG TPA: penicillin-binding transpeptidase domain-containing protein, partial [Planctomycetota bacterium]|nr:penicillin-binding transpeptidase domain-containing protein [Planctomycetota bacterium]
DPGRDAETQLAGRATDLAGDLADCLLHGTAADPARRVELRTVLRNRILSAGTRAAARLATDKRTASVTVKADFLVADDVCRAAAVEALSALAADPRWPTLHLHYRTRYERSYPGGEACVGPVGFIAERDRPGEIRTRLEAIDGLRGGVPGRREVHVGPRKQRYWTGNEVPPRPPGSLVTTLDLDLQRAAHAELLAAVDQAIADRGAAPSWGALLLAEVATGNVLAMASYVEGSHPRVAAFTPTQRQFEPGSVVKPLVFAVALRRGVIDWHRDLFDCTEGAPGRGWRVRPPDPSLRGSRRIYDDHACGRLTPAEVLIQSSNVGAVQVGLRTGVEGLEEYVRYYRFGQPTGLGLPNEANGRCRTDLAALPPRAFWFYTGASYCFGYELMVTPAQMLRAYLYLLARQPRDLRLLDAVEVDGERIALHAPEQPAGEPFLSAEQLDLITAAMVGVVSDREGATGRHVAALLERLGVAPGVVAGKTGTSVDRISQVRTASFAAFAPASAPRYLAFCVLQKDRAEGFYGGRYAAPAATRLLLHALGVLAPGDAAAGEAVRAQQVRAASRVRRTVASAESTTGR